MCGTQVMPAFSLSIAIFQSEVMPPILFTLGWTKSTAPAAIILRKSEGLVAFSPMASGTPVALRNFAADSKSSGGQIGSSTQCGFDAFIAATGASASPGSQAQLVSTLMGMPGPVTERAAATTSAV